MWSVIKAEKNQNKFLNNELLKILGKNCKFYIPMLLIKSFKNKKIVSKSTPLIGEYFFCFHESFKEENFTKSLNSIRGLKYFFS